MSLLQVCKKAFDAGLTGGGSAPGPGEVSLAHNGVHFLDELPEFHRHVLDVPRRLTQIRVQWKSGAVDELTVKRPGPADHNRTPSASVERIRQLATLGLFDRVIAKKLNAEEVRSGSGRAWTASAVKHVRLEHQIFGAAAVTPRRDPLPDRHPDGRYSDEYLAEPYPPR